MLNMISVKSASASLGRTFSRRMMMSTFQKPVVIPKDYTFIINGPRHRAEDVLSDSSEFLGTSSESSATGMPVELLAQVIAEQELNAIPSMAKKSLV